jgi:DNA-binding response OmpR family regulator
VLSSSSPNGHRWFTRPARLAGYGRFAVIDATARADPHPLPPGAVDGLDGGLDTPGLQHLVFGPMEIRPDEFQVLVGGRRVGLTVREFQVLLVLAEREDRVVRRGEIYRRVWGGEMKHRDRSVDVFVRKVRNKLTRVAPEWVYIHTHFGIGYRFAPAPTDAP